MWGLLRSVMLIANFGLFKNDSSREKHFEISSQGERNLYLIEKSKDFMDHGGCF